jgi:hypothetical protein
MPNAIDRCASCQQPLYVEEHVAGGCDCSDRDLRILLAQQRQRNNSGNPDFASAFMASGPPDLSSIDPGILMSAAGRSEFEGAKQLAGPRGRTQVMAVLDDEAPFTASNAPQPVGPTHHQDDGIGWDLDAADGGNDWTGNWQDHGRHNARVASVASAMDNTDLAAMWMQGTGIPFDPAQLAAPGGDGFEFDTELAVDTSAYPRGGGASGPRFRVDGAPPARPAFDRGLVNDMGPTTVAARVGRDGRFPVLREQPVPRPRVQDIFDQVRAQAARIDAPARPEPRPPVSAIQQARDIQARSRGPSVYDLIRSSPLSSKD